MEDMENLNEQIKERVEQEKKEVKHQKIKYPLKALCVILLSLIFIALISVILVLNKEGKITEKVKTSLDKIVEKSDLETINVTYNIIAKQCKKNDCDKKSNNIDDYKYVVSCKGTITAGINFKDVKIDEDIKNKKIIVTVPEATLTGEPTIGSVKFLNGEDVSADELPNARKLCQEETKAKSETDDKLIPAAKEQAKTVLEEFYKQWIKSYDNTYVVEVK